MNCRHCQKKLVHDFVNLGYAPPSNAYLTPEHLNQPEQTFPLKARVCDACWLVQADQVQQASELFSPEYAYFSSYSSSWLAHARHYVDLITKRLLLGPASNVVEIASNDGYLLQNFIARRIPCYGIEPTAGTAAVARAKGIEVIEEFFGANLAKSLSRQKGLADLIIGNNVIAHIPDINDFVGGIRRLLKPDGVVTLEFPHLLELVSHRQFDTIYHEHFSYLSLGTIRRIFESCGLEIFDVEQLPTHGGSLRIYGQHPGSREISPSVDTLLKTEARRGMEELSFYRNFQAEADQIRREFLGFLNRAREENHSIAAYGAAAKGNTLLNFCGVSGKQIEYVVDQSPHKQGLYLPGSRIPILSPSKLRETKPDYVIILPWNISEEILRQHSYIGNWGGRFVSFIPELRVYPPF